MATIKDIALKAGVSTATVSHVINQTRFVSEKLKETVHNAIRELNYHPNAIARSLVLKQTQTIGVIITDILNPFYTAVVRGIEDATSRKGYNVILCNTDEDPGKEDLYIKLLLGKRVDGIAISTAFKERVHPLIDKLCQVSVVTIVRKMEGIRTDAVFGDNVGGAYKAIDHLVGLGHRKIGVISGPHGLSSGRERLEGCLKAFSANGLKPAPEWILMGDFKKESGYNLTLKILGLTNRPSALFACNNQMTLGALQAIHESGLDIPRDISLIGIDNTEWSAFMAPPLTVIDQSPYLMGKRAGEVLLKRIQNKHKTPKKVIIPSKLIVRNSTGRPRGRRRSNISIFSRTTAKVENFHKPKPQLKGGIP